jgi:hypothetical protein
MGCGKNYKLYGRKKQQRADGEGKKGESKAQMQLKLITKPLIKFHSQSPQLNSFLSMFFSTIIQQPLCAEMAKGEKTSARYL